MRKVLALTLASAIAVGMTTAAFAASSTKYVSMSENLTFGYSGTHTTDTIDLGEIRADGLEVRFQLYSEMFNAANGVTPPAAGTKLTASDIRSSKIVVRSQIKGGSKTVSNISIENKTGSVIVEFVDEWVSTKEQDFEVFVYLTIDGKRNDEYGAYIIGTMANPEIEIYSDYEYVDLSNGYVAAAQEFVPRIEVDLGNGVSIFTKFFKDKKYYGIATREQDENALTVIAQHPDIDNVVTLKTVGLNSTGDVVRLDTDYSDYYVYDANLNYLGQSNEPLPYSTKYYLANKTLNIVENEPEINEEEEEDDYLENNHMNPGTGR